MNRRRSARLPTGVRSSCDDEANRHVRQVLRLGHEERPHHDASESGPLELGDDLVDPVLARVEVEHELLLRERAGTREERRTVARVVDRAEHRGRSDRRGRDVRVELPHLDVGGVAELRGGRLDHRRLGVDAAVAKAAREEVRPEPAVPARQVEHLVARLERDTERRDELRAVREIRVRRGVLLLRPAGRLARVLPRLVAHRRPSVSG